MSHNLCYRPHKLYYDRSITTDRTVHDNRPDIVALDKAIKEAHLIDAAVPNSQHSHPSQHHRRKAPEVQVHGPKRRARTNMATERRLYNTTSTIHGADYARQITRRFKAA
jgi:hypothetical protein